MQEKPKNILVAKKEISGRYANQYRFFDKANPDKTLAYCSPINFTDVLDSCILCPINGVQWDLCEVIDTHQCYTVYFDDEYKKSLSKDLLVKLVAINTGTNMYATEDVIEEVENLCASNEADVEDIILDYLGLDAEYAWIFK